MFQTGKQLISTRWVPMFWLGRNENIIHVSVLLLFLTPELKWLMDIFKKTRLTVRIHLSIFNFVALIFTCKLTFHVSIVTMLQSILPASIFYLAKTFLRHVEEYIKHIDLDLMNSGYSWDPLDLRRDNDYGGRALWWKIITIIVTFATPG